MQEVIIIDDMNEIPKDYKYDTETSDVWVYRHKYTGHEIHIAKQPPLYIQAIYIPENATNGEMLKAMFPRIQIKEGSDFITYSLDGVVGTCVEKSWWNAPYKKQ